VRGLKDLDLAVETVPRLVRGLDYYTRTVFEVHAAGLGAQSAVGGGGRYDQLVRDLGGPDTQAIGFSIGMDRLHLVTASLHAAGASRAPDAFVVAREPGAAVEALRAARALRGVLEPGAGAPLRVLTDVQGRGASSQMKVASRLGARFVVFVPRDPDGYAIRDMIEGKDEMKQPDLDACRTWLRAHRAAAAGAR
jgi:histidyl-tRNA synthetase